MSHRRRSTTDCAHRAAPCAGWRPACGLRRAVVAVLIALAFAASGSAARGEEAPVDEPVRLGRDALRSSGRLPWYDASRDGVQPVAVKPSEQDAANRDSRWTKSPRQRRAVRGPRGGGIGGLGRIGHVIGWSVLVVLLIVLVSVLVYFFFHADTGEELRGGEEETIAGRAAAETEARLQQLPVDVRTGGTASLLDRARVLMELGRYNEAIVYCFSHLLVQLDRHQRIRLTRGKTNRQYLRELGPQGRLREITGGVMLAFEDAFFGNHPLSAERFGRCWQELDEFHRLLEASGEGQG